MQDTETTPKIIADFHSHTIASTHAYSTITEYAKYASEIGLKYFSTTNHAPQMPDGAHYYHFVNLKMVPRELFGVRILKGIEANIIDPDGKLDIPKDSLDFLEFVLFTFHPKCGYEDRGEDLNTEVMIKAMDRNKVSAVAHPENGSFIVNPQKIVEALVRRDILLEVNNSSYISRPGREESMLEFLYWARKLNAKISLGSDAHFHQMLGDFEYSISLCKKADIDFANIINFDEELIQRYIFKNAKGPEPTFGKR